MKHLWPILVVDDEPVQRESMAVWLKQDGYDVDVAASGREAIQAAKKKDYAIYFIDLKMPPGIDGIEAMVEIRAIHPDAAVIIITAYGTVANAVAAAIGTRIYDLPITPERVWRALNGKGDQ